MGLKNLSQILRTGQTMAAKFLALPLCLLLQGAMAAEVDFGIVRLDGAGHGMLITAKPLDAAGLVLFQFPLKNGRSFCCKRLQTTEFKSVSADTVVATNELTGDAPHVYQFRLPRQWAESAFVGVAASGLGIQAKGKATWLTAADAQGHSSRAGTCTSQEGVHLIERQGETERTHLYLSLGYDLEAPNCP